MHDHHHRPPLRLVTGAGAPDPEESRAVSRRLILVAPRRRRRVDWCELGVLLLMLTSVGASVEALRSATAPAPPTPDERTWALVTTKTPQAKAAPRPPARREATEVAL